jgi:hypothetical protein
VIGVANLREWRGHQVLDPEGSKIGSLESVYVDTRTDEPAFLSVTIGMPGRKRLVFVPLVDAVVGPGYVRVAYPKKQVRSAPSIGTDGELAATAEPEVFAHYDLPHQPGPNGERRLARR